MCFLFTGGDNLKPTTIAVHISVTRWALTRVHGKHVATRTMDARIAWTFVDLCKDSRKVYWHWSGDAMRWRYDENNYPSTLMAAEHNYITLVTHCPCVANRTGTCEAVGIIRAVTIHAGTAETWCDYWKWSKKYQHSVKLKERFWLNNYLFPEKNFLITLRRKQLPICLLFKKFGIHINDQD